ncbi:MAG: S1 family peptidase, partial [Leifsonia sp.]
MGGDPYEFEDSSGDGFRCSVGFNGFSASGVREFVSAGHCTTTVSGSVYIATATAPYDNPASDGCDFCTPIGTAVAGQGKFGTGFDYGLVGVPGVVTVGALTGWGTDGTTNSDPTSAPAGLNATPQYVTGESAAETGAVLCKSGSTSGWTCGIILDVDSSQVVRDDGENPHTVNSILATTCVLSGDSGGGAVMGSTAVGIASASNFPRGGDDGGICGNTGSGSDPNNYHHLSLFFPMMSAAGQMSVQGQLGSSWQIETGVHTPVLTFPAPDSRTITQVTSTDFI